MQGLLLSESECAAWFVWNRMQVLLPGVVPLLLMSTVPHAAWRRQQAALGTVPTNGQDPVGFRGASHLSHLLKHGQSTWVDTFSKWGTKMAKRHMKRCSAPLSLRKRRTEAKRWCHRTPTRMAAVKDELKSPAKREKRGHFHRAGGNAGRGSC